MLTEMLKHTLTFLVASCIVACQTTTSGVPMQTNEDNVAADFRSVVELWQKRDIDHISNLVDDNYRGHTSGGERNREGLRLRIEKFHELYANIQFKVLDQIVSGDRVATRLEASCTERSTGKALHMIGLNISIFKNGKQVEEWATWEILASSG